MKPRPKIIDRILEAVRDAQIICVVGHIRPDGDCIGSQLGLTLALKAAGTALYAYQATGLQKLVRTSGLLKLMGKMGRVEELAPSAEMPQFYRYYGRTLPAIGPKRQRYRLASGANAITFRIEFEEYRHAGGALHKDRSPMRGRDKCDPALPS